MRRGWIAACLALLALALSAAADNYGSSEWKDEIAHAYLPYRKLTYDDFPETAGVPTPHVMHTQGFVHYTYRAHWTQEESQFTAKIVEISVRSGFDQNKSWRQTGFTQTKALLAHEQGHLDINELHAEELKNATLPDGTGESGPAALDDLKNKLKDLFERVNKEAQDEQDSYDRETNHGAIQSQQDAWNKALRERLDFYKITYWNQSQ